MRGRGGEVPSQTKSGKVKELLSRALGTDVHVCLMGQTSLRRPGFATSALRDHGQFVTLSGLRGPVPTSWAYKDGMGPGCKVGDPGPGLELVVSSYNNTRDLREWQLHPSRSSGQKL